MRGNTDEDKDTAYSARTCMDKAVATAQRIRMVQKLREQFASSDRKFELLSSHVANPRTREPANPHVATRQPPDNRQLLDTRRCPVATHTILI